MSDRQLPTPSVPDLACIEGETLAQVIEWLTAYYEGDGCPWNYRPGTRAIKVAYKGFDRLDLLLASCQQIKNKQGRASNGEIVELAAPKAFGRSIQVFDLPARKFSFGRMRRAAYRVPFFFVERGIVKLYYLQPRKEHGPSVDQLGMVAKIHKQYLLDTEFFGLPSNVEYVNLGALEKKGPRVVRTSFAGYPPTLVRPATNRSSTTLISEALDKIEKHHMVETGEDQRGPAGKCRCSISQ